MMEHRQSRGEAAILAQLKQLDPSSERFHMLSAARDFKAAWVQLGEKLTLVREKETFRAWGYTNFEAYCRRELHIKQDTANKLTRSFAFLRDHQPTLLDDTNRKTAMPALDVVDLLSQARTKSKISESDFANLTQEVLTQENASTKDQVLKRLREVDPDAFRPAVKPAREPGDNDLRKALLLAERLYSVLEIQSGMPPDVVASTRRIVNELKSRFEASRQDQQDEQDHGSDASAA